MSVMASHHMFYCVVDNCCINTHSGMPFFRCPKDPVRCQQWKESLGFTGEHKFANLSPAEAHSRIRICSVHFADDCFTYSGKRLLTTAIPSKTPQNLQDCVKENQTPEPSKVYMATKCDASTQTDIREFTEDVSTQTDFPPIVPSEEAKKQWKNLRDGYRTALKNLASSKTTDTGKRPKPWKFFDKMSFLNPYMKDRAKTIISEETMSNFSTENIQDFDENCSESNEDKETDQAINTLLNQNSQEHRNSRTAFRPSKRLHASIGTDEPEYLHEETSKSEEPSIKRQKIIYPTQDSLKLFFDSMYASTKVLPPSLQRLVKTTLFEAVNEAEIEAEKTGLVGGNSKVKTQYAEESEDEYVEEDSPSPVSIEKDLGLNVGGQYIKEEMESL